MEDGNRKTDYKERAANAEGVFAAKYPLISPQICPACGAEASRDMAKFCLTCGKLLKEEYQPLDTIRASYRLQGKNFQFENQQREDVTDLFQRNKNAVSETAWACFVYSLVPYLGILFIPLTIIIGVSGFAVAQKQPQLGGRKLSLVSIGLSFPVLIIQIFLWWLLYIIPELSKQI